MTSKVLVTQIPILITVSNPCVLQIVRERGWLGLFRGNTLNVVRAAPQKALDFFSFEIYKVRHFAMKLDQAKPQITLALLVRYIVYAVIYQSWLETLHLAEGTEN